MAIRQVGTGRPPRGGDEVLPAWKERASRLNGASIAEAVHLLGRRGYVRTFEVIATALWCRSSETCFDPSTLAVDSVTEVDGGTVLAVREPATGVSGVWIVVEPTEQERRLLARLIPAPALRPTREHVATRRMSPPDGGRTGDTGLDLTA